MANLILKKQTVKYIIDGHIIEKTRYVVYLKKYGYIEEYTDGEFNKQKAIFSDLNTALEFMRGNFGRVTEEIIAESNPE